MALVMIALVAVSFAPSFYLRPWFPQTLSGAVDIPPHLVLHGTALTGWFLLFLAQSVLVKASRTDVHRRLGYFGAVLALAVVATSVVTTVSAVPRFTAAGVDPNLVALVVVGDFLSLAQFSILVCCGVVLRSRPAAHKRLMLFASLALLGPGVFGGDRPITLLQPFVPFPLALAFQIVTIGAVVANDVVSLRRVHPATIWGGVVANVLMIVLFGASLATGVGQNVATWLK
jgi:uncharacterized membrane protein YozB (DUF420 family)